MIKRIWAVGDGATGTFEAHRIADMMIAQGCDLFLWLGDVYESGTLDEWLYNYASVYGMLFDKTIPTPGNHDWYNYTTGFDVYFKRLLRETKGAHCFARRIGTWQILSINSEEDCSEDSAQLEWLRAQLAKTYYGKRRIVMFHRPRYCSGSHGDAPDMEPVMQAIEGKCKIVLSGHAHNMQRFKPDKRGITQFVSGAGGRAHYATVLNDPLLDYGDPASWGALRLDIEGSRCTHAFVDQHGDVLDQGVIEAK